MKKRIIILGVVVLVVALAWSGGWLFLANQLRQQIDAFAFADGETSPQLTCATLNISGYPFSVDVECVDAVVVSGDVMAEIPAVRASALIYRPNHVLASARGPAQISDAFTGQQSELAWAELNGSLRVENWRIARLSIVGSEVSWADRLFGDALLAKADALELHLLDIPEMHDAERGLSALAAYLRTQALDVPMMTLAAADIELEAELSGLPDDLRRIGAEPILPLWQRNGGTLNLVSLRAKDASADLEASGQVQLDDQGRPNGKIDISSAGVAERIGPMIEEPWRTLVLGTPGADGRHTNQLNFSNGNLSSGLVPITTLPPLF